MITRLGINRLFTFPPFRIQSPPLPGLSRLCGRLTHLLIVDPQVQELVGGRVPVLARDETIESFEQCLRRLPDTILSEQLPGQTRSLLVVTHREGFQIAHMFCQFDEDRPRRKRIPYCGIEHFIVSQPIPTPPKQMPLQRWITLPDAPLAPADAAVPVDARPSGEGLGKKSCDMICQISPRRRSSQARGSPARGCRIDPCQS